MDERIIASINKTKKGFEESFSTGDFYNKQTQDFEHLDKIMRLLPIKDGMKILDLGTGSGFMSFAIANKYPNVSITGLDIVEKTLQRNRDKADNENLHNIDFISYDGIQFPFENQQFDMVINRYVLHHFPAICESMKEIKRVLKNNGFLFISDPAPNDEDKCRFVDEYMQLKKDGHIKFYTKQEWKDICGEQYFELIDSFESTIRFPKKLETAPGFDDLCSRYDENILKGYDLKIIDNEIYITEKVNNLLFKL